MVALEQKQKIEIIIGLFLFGGIVGYVLIPMAFSADTIILTTKDGGVPDSCAPASGLVLAQNLTDLCDVVIITPATNQLISYNGSHWVNTNEAVLQQNATCANIGSGSIICASYLDNNLNFKSLVSGVGVSLSNDSDTITITNSSPDNTVCANVGSGSQIYKDGECNFRTIGYGTGITLTNGTDVITVNNSLPEVTACSNDGHGAGNVCNGSNVHLKGIASGTNIAVTQNGTDVIISNTGGTESTTAFNVGNGANIFKNQTSAILYFKTLLVGSGISISNSTNTITFTNSLPEATVCSNTGSSLDAIVCNGGNVALKGFKESTGIDIVNNTNDVTIKTKFANGTGISITGSTTQTFTNTGVISNSCSSGISCSGTNPSAFTNSGVTSNVAGAGISVSGATGAVTVSNTGVLSMTSGDTNSLTFSASTGAITATPNWKKLCDVTASGGETSLTCTLSSSEQNLMVFGVISFDTDTTTVMRMRFNGDSGNNYAVRTGTNGGADTTTINDNGMVLIPSSSTAGNMFYVQQRCIDMASAIEKNCSGNRVTSANGAGNVPSRTENSMKWANTASRITSVAFVRSAGTGVFQSGNEIMVWGGS